jgi:hypothetical protein
MATGLLGGYSGYQRGGLPGAVAGATLGIAAPEMIASPTGEMFLARTLNSQAPKLLSKAFTGGGLQLTRDK